MKGRVTLNFVLALIGIVACVLFALSLPRLAKAEERPLYLLMFVMAKIQQVYPKVVPMLSLDDCLIQAAKLNKTDPDMQDPRAKEFGAEWVCLQVHRVTV